MEKASGRKLWPPFRSLIEGEAAAAKPALTGCGLLVDAVYESDVHVIRRAFDQIAINVCIELHREISPLNIAAGADCLITLLRR